jgi:hypothetical protein
MTDQQPDPGSGPDRDEMDDAAMHAAVLLHGGPMTVQWARHRLPDLDDDRISAAVRRLVAARLVRVNRRPGGNILTAMPTERNRP